jgi:hypothetical protein
MKNQPSEDEQKFSVIESEIFHAIQHCQYQQLALYLRHNYKLTIRSKDGRNGLFYALNINNSYKRRRMIRYCLDHGINPLQKEYINGYTVLNEAIARQQIDSFQILLSEVSGEIDWQSLDNHGQTILHQAVKANNATILENMITIMNRYNISVDIVDKNGLTPYLLARKLHLLEMADILYKKGHASRQKCDQQTHRSAREWEDIGIRENHFILRKKLREEINDAMRKGKIDKVKKLKKLYQPTFSFSVNEDQRRESYLTMNSRPGANTKSSLSINEMIDRLSEGDKPESYVHSRTDEQTFYIEHLVPTTTLPPIISRHRADSTFNVHALMDLFQIAQTSS